MSTYYEECLEREVRELKKQLREEKDPHELRNFVVGFLVVTACVGALIWLWIYYATYNPADCVTACGATGVSECHYDHAKCK